MKNKLKQNGPGLAACVYFIKIKIIHAEKAVQFREDAVKCWQGGTDKSWRAAGCPNSKETRMKIAESHARIAVKSRQELEMFKAVLKQLESL
jgi:hypothetical protein